MLKKSISVVIVSLMAACPAFSQTILDSRVENSTTLSYPGVTASAVNSAANGGVIYNTGTIDITENSDFIANSTSGLGGAIYIGNGGVINFSGTGQSQFLSNSDSIGSNDVYMETGSTMNLTDGSYVFDGGIAGAQGAQIVNSAALNSFSSNMARFYGTYTQSGAGAMSTMYGDTGATYVIETGTSDFKGSLTSTGSIDNDGSITFSGSNKTIDGTVTGTGTTNITGTIVNNGTIEQGGLSISATGDLTTDAGAVTLTDTSITNKGSLRLTDAASTVLNYDITNGGTTGKGDLYIVGSIDNSAGKTVTQNSLTIENGGAYITTAASLNGIESAGILNDGTLTITGSSAALGKNIDSSSSGLGSLYVDAVLNNTGTGAKTISQNNIYINSGKSLTSALSNITVSNMVFNGGDLGLSGGGALMGITNISPSVKGNLELSGGDFTASRTISQNNLTIKDSASLTMSLANLSISGTVLNQGSLDFTAGSNTASIFNTGSLTFSGTGMYNTVLLSNSGTMTVSGGLSNSAAISGTGEIIVSGSLTNTGNNANSITQNKVTVESGAFLSSDAGVFNLSQGMKNDGTLTYTGGKNSAAITGAGALQITGTVENTASITQNTVKISTGADLKTDIADITAANGIKNGGILRHESTGASTITSDISYDGSRGTLLVQKGNLTNADKTITQDEIVISTGASFTSQAGTYLDLVSGFTNSGSLYLTGGANANAIANNGTLDFSGSMTNSAAITGTGKTVISGTLNNSGSITQKDIEIGLSGNFTTAVTDLSLSGTIANANIFTLTGSGTINNAISGAGSLNINGDISMNLTDGYNKAISQKSLMVNAGKTFTANRDLLNIGSGGITLYGELKLASSADGNFESLGPVQLMNGSSFNTQSDWADNSTFTTLNAASGSKIKMDIFNNELVNGRNDKISVGSATLDGELYVRAGVGTYTNATYELVVASGSLNGALLDDIMNKTNLLTNFDDNGLGLTWVYNANSKTISIIINGINTSSLLSLPGLNYNQTQVAGLFDSLSSTATGDVENVINNIIITTEEQQKDALQQIAPVFLANLVRPQTSGAERGALYNHIKEHCGDGLCDAPAFWVQAQSGTETLEPDYNYTQDYEYKNTTVFFGADKYFADYEASVGFYGKYNQGDVEQGLSTADVKSYGGGFYGGIKFEEWEVRGLLGASYDNYDSKRRIFQSDALLDRTAVSDFNSYTVRGDVEFAYNHALGSMAAFRPFIGAEAAMLNYGSFEEKGADSLNMKVKSGNTLSTSLRLGAGLNGSLFSRVGWNIGAEYNFLIIGSEPEIEAVFAGTDEKIKFKGDEAGEHTFGVNAGLNIKVTNNISVFGSGYYKTGSGYSDTRANVGLRYAFCTSCYKYRDTDAEKFDITAYKTAEPKKEQAQGTEALAPGAEQAAPYRLPTEEEKINGDKLIIISDSFFDSNNNTKMTPELQNFLIEKSKEINAIDYNTISVTGHMDKTESPDNDKKLSLERADMVADFLMLNGITQRRVKVRGEGSDYPVADNSNPIGRMQNRRVEVRID